MSSRYDLVMDEGATFTWAFVWYTSLGPPAVPKDLSGWTAKLQIRAAKDEASPVIDERSTTAGSIVLGGPTGSVAIDWNRADTIALSAALADADDDELHYDLKLTSADNKDVVLFDGPVVVRQRVTVLP